MGVLIGLELRRREMNGMVMLFVHMRYTFSLQFDIEALFFDEQMDKIRPENRQKTLTKSRLLGNRIFTKKGGGEIIESIN